MDELLKNLISQLSESPTVLSEATTRKIHRLIPVPTDYKIIWADISSFGGYPAGVVITDRALVTKATRNEDKAQKAQIKEKNKTDGKKQKPPKFIYRIVLWEYFSPDEYEVEKREDENGIFRYILKTGTTVIAEFSSKALFKLLQNYKRAVANQQEAVEATFSAINSVNAEGVMFNAAYGADQSKSGHGIRPLDGHALQGHEAEAARHLYCRGRRGHHPDWLSLQRDRVSDNIRQHHYEHSSRKRIKPYRLE